MAEAMPDVALELKGEENVDDQQVNDTENGHNTDAAPMEDCEGYTLLSEVEHNGVTYRIGEFAMFGANETSKPRVGQIEHIKRPMQQPQQPAEQQPPPPQEQQQQPQEEQQQPQEHEQEQEQRQREAPSDVVKLRLRLFYWPEDTRVGLHDYHGRIELIESDDSATTVVSELKGKCKVEPLIDFGKRENPPTDVFYFVDFYDHVKGRIKKNPAAIGKEAAEFDSGDEASSKNKRKDGPDGKRKKKKGAKRARQQQQQQPQAAAAGSGSDEAVAPAADGTARPNQQQEQAGSASEMPELETAPSADKAADSGTEPSPTPTKRKAPQIIDWKEGMVVWGKVRTFPWWPARIVPAVSVSEKIQQQRKPESWLVQFIGSEDYGWMDRRSILPFRKFLRSKSKTDDPLLKAAIDEALVQCAEAEKAVPMPTLDDMFCELCKKSDDEDKMLLCDGCDHGFHLYCLKPPLDKIPETSWYCAVCRKKGQASSKSPSSSAAAAGGSAAAATSLSGVVGLPTTGPDSMYNCTVQLLNSADDFRNKIMNKEMTKASGDRLVGSLHAVVCSLWPQHHQPPQPDADLDSDPAAAGPAGASSAAAAASRGELLTAFRTSCAESLAPPRFSGSKHEDIGEFLERLLAHLDQHVLPKSPPTSATPTAAAGDKQKKPAAAARAVPTSAGEEQQQPPTLLLSDAFSGVMAVTATCPAGHVEKWEEPFNLWSVRFPAEGKSRSQSVKPLPLDELLAADDSIDRVCAECGGTQHVSCRRRRLPCVWPRYLAVRLLRFPPLGSASGTSSSSALAACSEPQQLVARTPALGLMYNASNAWWAGKKEREVIFPRTLELSKPAQPGSSKSSTAAAATAPATAATSAPAAAAASPPYRLSGVINHKSNAMGGHYSVLLQDQTSKSWLHVDDMNFKQIPDKEVQSPHAYILLYRRQDM